MSNIVWNAENGWHDGAEIDNAELLRSLHHGWSTVPASPDR